MTQASAAGWSFEANAGQPVQPDHLDQRPDLRLRPAQEDRAAALAQAPREHRQVDHQRRVGEHQLTQIDHDVGIRTDRTDHRLATTSLRSPILVSRAAKDRRLLLEVDDVSQPIERGQT